MILQSFRIIDVVIKLIERNSIEEKLFDLNNFHVIHELAINNFRLRFSLSQSLSVGFADSGFSFCIRKLKKDEQKRSSD